MVKYHIWYDSCHAQPPPQSVGPLTIVGVLSKSSFAGGTPVLEGAQAAISHLLRQLATSQLCGENPHTTSSSDLLTVRGGREGQSKLLPGQL